MAFRVVAYEVSRLRTSVQSTSETDTSSTIAAGDSTVTSYPDWAVRTIGHHQIELTLLLVLAVGPLVLRASASYIFAPAYVWFVIVSTVAAMVAVTFSGFLQRPRWRYASTAVAVWAGAVVVVLTCTTSFFAVRGAELASNLVTGSPPYFSQFIFSLRRQPVCVAGTQDHFFVLLSQTGDRVVLFDPIQGVILMPAAVPDLRVPLPPSTSCAS